MTNIVSAPILHKNDLVHYARGKNGQRVGLVVARNVGGRVTIGWSAVNTKAGDSFNKERAIEIALSRTLTGTKVEPPSKVKRVLKDFPERCKRYFKDANEIVAA